MIRYIPLFIAFLILNSCEKQSLISIGIEGGDEFYKDCTKLDLVSFNEVSSRLQINIDGYPLDESFGSCDLFLSKFSDFSSSSQPISIEAIRSPDTILKIGTYSDIIYNNSTPFLYSDSTNVLNFAYLFIEFNNRRLIISDTLVWRNSTVIYPF